METSGRLKGPGLPVVTMPQCIECRTFEVWAVFDAGWRTLLLRALYCSGSDGVDLVSLKKLYNITLTLIDLILVNQRYAFGTLLNTGLPSTIYHPLSLVRLILRRDMVNT